MISILIPIFNFDIRPLVADLARQCEPLGDSFEIICFDDGSDKPYKIKNRGITGKHIIYNELPQNIGRAAIRNALGNAAKFPYLLFMDCDSKVVRRDFIQKYVDHLAADTLLYGGRCYSNNPPQKADLFFHWKYGSEREQSSVEIRNKNPWHSFMTNNFLIPKINFEKINFDESLKHYGHEDTLFGLELKNKKIKIIHLDNPLEHIGLETTDVFIYKTKKGLENLFYLYKKNTPIETKLLSYFTEINKWNLKNVISAIFKLSENHLIKNLKSRNPNLKIFDFYKLGYLCSINK